MAYNETMKVGNAMSKTIVETDSGEYAYYGETLTIAGESVQILYGQSDLGREILSDATFTKLAELVSANAPCAIIRANDLMIQSLRVTNDDEELLNYLIAVVGANAEYIAYMEEKVL
jgi:hypothetical protein